jgi:hypothetical protein
MEVLGIIALLCAFIWWRVKAGDELIPSKNKFVAMGNIQGWPIEMVVKRVGRPTSISAQASGQLYQWLKIRAGGGYHYAISVDRAGKVIGYTHQSGG